MSNDEKDFPAVDKRFGEYVSVWAREASAESVEAAWQSGMTDYLRAHISCSAFNTENLAVAQSVAAALLEAVAYAREVNRERGLE